MRGEAGGLAYELERGAADEGGRPPLVLIHGAGGDGRFWPPALRRLAWSAVYTLDLPGHGRSPGEPRASVAQYAQVVGHWMEALGLPAAVLAGHSMGGAIAMQIALAQPARAAGLVLVGTGARLRVHPDLLSMAGKAQSHAQAARWITRWSFAPEADETLLELATRRLMEGDPAALKADFQACDAFDLMGRLGEIKVPALVLCGQEDKMTPPKYSRFLAEHLPQAELVIIPGAGHMVMLERPSQVAAAVQDFLARHCT